MSNPISVSDGNFAASSQNGPWTYRYPFLGKGDATTFVASRKMRIAEASFVVPVAMTSLSFVGQGGQTGYLVNNIDTKDVGNGLLEWTEDYASIPVSRMEFGSVVYTQVVDFSGGTPLQFTGNFDGAKIYEYEKLPPAINSIPRFITTPSAGTIPNFDIVAMPTLTSPRIIELGAGVFYVTALTAPDIIAQGVSILAEDTTTSIYMGRIVERISVYLKKKTLTLV